MSRGPGEPKKQDYINATDRNCKAKTGTDRTKFFSCLQILPYRAYLFSSKLFQWTEINCNGLNCFPPNVYGEVPTSITSECDYGETEPSKQEWGLDGINRVGSNSVGLVSLQEGGTWNQKQRWELCKAANQGTSGVPEAGKGKEGLFPRGFRGCVALPSPDF